MTRVGTLASWSIVLRVVVVAALGVGGALVVFGLLSTVADIVGNSAPRAGATVNADATALRVGAGLFNFPD
jgi:hypothetical protein